MKRWFLVAACGVIVTFAAQSGRAQTNSVLGAWHVAIKGHDNGIAYLIFTNDYTMTGWGIKSGSLGTFTISGVWSMDSKNRIMCGYLEESAGNTASGNLVGRFKKHNGITFKANAANGRFTFLGDNSTNLPDISGAWIGNVISGGSGHYETLTIAASTNGSGAFTLGGSGTSADGAYTVTGTILADSQRHVAGYDIYEFEGGDTVTNSFSGRLNKRVDSGNFKGVDNEGHNLRFSITR